ncbi:transcriptional regulator [Acidaminobacter sp. JC074]|uniref:type IV toxin-antitoxin system AbiEi family antitoxin domain-containing protein n=1 Tax=Acidaminobacter sp. JC074 TaxID=2530199 RepID=UPI001F0E0681|nr:type IV toxin-antitoxin system AbiEi family antitoxin [Acidaminobacter sp. JC074]MCH4891310.1 transcriptional regulator [Acidaminobacter sp. JC074]
MKEYERLAKKITFSLGDVTAITGNESTSTSLISRWLKKNYVVRIRKDLYTCIDLTTGDVIANKYQIATAINDSSFVAYHTAFELYGMANQVYNIVYVSSNKRFNTFEFEGITYKFVKSGFDDGVVEIRNTEGIKVTDVERTYIDSVNFLSKIAGVEELINITESIERLNKEKLIKYLELYDKKVLYQKVGYFLENYYVGEKLGDNFFEMCKTKSGNSVRYLLGGREGRYNDRWKLVIPEEYILIKDGHGEPDDFI